MATVTTQHLIQDDTLDKYWHLICEDAVGDGEYTSCGIAGFDEWGYPEGKRVKRGGVTCPECLKVIKYYKNQVKL